MAGFEAPDDSAFGTYSSNDRKLMVWDLEKGRQLAELADLEEYRELAFMADNRTLVTCGNRSMRFWRLPAEAAPGSSALVELRSSGDATEGVSALQFTPDVQQLLVGSKAGVNVWGVEGHKLLQRLRSHGRHAGHVFALAPQGNALVLFSHSSGKGWFRHGTEWRAAGAELPVELPLRLILTGWQTVGDGRRKGKGLLNF